MHRRASELHLNTKPFKMPYENIMLGCCGHTMPQRGAASGAVTLLIQEFMGHALCLFTKIVYSTFCHFTARVAWTGRVYYLAPNCVYVGVRGPVLHEVPGQTAN